MRAAARLAAALKADWLAVYVETPKLQRLSDEQRERTLDALKLASELGAETVTLDGADAAATLIDYAQHAQCVEAGGGRIGDARAGGAGCARPVRRAHHRRQAIAIST